MVPVAILAGGLATRLGSLTEKTPKVLVSVAGRPFIEHQLALLRSRGCGHVVLCLGHLGEQVQRHLQGRPCSGLRIEYMFDGPTLLGTGGALRRALPSLGEAFFVMYGDSYLPCDFQAVEAAFHACGTPGLMTVFRNEGRWDRSNVLFRDGRVVRYEKRNPTLDMHYIDYGLGILKATVLSKHADGAAFELSDVYTELAEAGALSGYEIFKRFYEIGSPAGLAAAENYLSSHSSLEFLP